MKESNFFVPSLSLYFSIATILDYFVNIDHRWSDTFSPHSFLNLGFSLVALTHEIPILPIKGIRFLVFFSLSFCSVLFRPQLMRTMRGRVREIERDHQFCSTMMAVTNVEWEKWSKRKLGLLLTCVSTRDPMKHHRCRWTSYFFFERGKKMFSSS